MDNTLTKEIISTIIIISVVTLICIFIKKFITKAIIKKAKKTSDKKLLTIVSILSNVIKYLSIIIAILMVLNIWGVDTKALITSLGIVGVVAGLSVQDLLKDIIAGISIITEDQFKVGDNIQVGDFRGTVISLGIKTTKVRSITGEVKFISNRSITEVINYSMMPLQCLIDISTDYQDELEKIETSLQNVCDKINKEVKYLKGKIQVLGVQTLDANSIIYRLSAEVDYSKYYEFRRMILKEVVQEFKEKGLNIPYPQMEVHSARI